MEGEKREITSGIYIELLKLYNSKKVEFERAEFCKFIGISENNTITYNKIMEVLKNYEIVTECASIRNAYHNAKRILINRKKLESVILKSKYYKLNDSFIHNCMFGAITP